MRGLVADRLSKQGKGRGKGEGKGTYERQTGDPRTVEAWATLEPRWQNLSKRIGDVGRSVFDSLLSQAS